MKGKMMKTKLKMTVLTASVMATCIPAAALDTRVNLLDFRDHVLPRREPSRKTGSRLFRKRWRKHMQHPESCTFRQELTLSGKPSI